MLASSILYQAGILAYRFERRRLQVRLVTSRETRRWIIPKGNIGLGMTAAQAAEQEAYEEAGVRGFIASAAPLGFYTYEKRLGSGGARPALVEVYLLGVERTLKRWPEKHQRAAAWFQPSEAIEVVGEPGLVPLLHRVLELGSDLVDATTP
jgi:8-oxo-dGTP pyrophosphatase MutT (NUDIX family)